MKDHLSDGRGAGACQSKCIASSRIVVTDRAIAIDAVVPNAPALQTTQVASAPAVAGIA